ncbi:Hydroxysteroid dehydrogenase-like protein 2 [Desmophyllum pertusum]|uniref:Hydroxysteroid dehydrogenase-like protein 2 n=1 Tax=Desmophyllum pertusum TaxID=174260 RepID=A0A9W9YK84_9CNID|nr:Hydroxysteroid dehydrogenase-like protein 2 [Desmophyllum pertusum]
MIGRQGSAGSGSFPGDEVNSTVMLDSEEFVALFTGHLNPAQAYLSGKLELKGSFAKFVILEKQLMRQMKSKL